MKILYVGPLAPDQTSRMRMEVLQELGHAIVPLDTASAGGGGNIALRAVARATGWTPGARQLNQSLVQLSRQGCDLIWVDKGLHLWRETVLEAKRLAQCPAVHYNPDDPFGAYRRGWRTFIDAIGAYDVHFVPRPQNVEEYRARGAQRVLEFDRGFHPRLHRPMSLSDSDRARYAAPVGFIGTWATERARSLAFLSARGVPLAIRGSDWSGQGHWAELRAHHRGGSVVGQEYAKALCGLDIALHYLRRENRDLQDSRTFEIPACGAFMLAERSVKHQELFEEGREAEFFDGDEELLEKLRYYQAHPELRRQIAAAGLQRCHASGYSYHDRMRALVQRATQVAAEP